QVLMDAKCTEHPVVRKLRKDRRSGAFSRLSASSLPPSTKELLRKLPNRGVCSCTTFFACPPDCRTRLPRYFMSLQPATALDSDSACLAGFSVLLNSVW